METAKETPSDSAPTKLPNVHYTRTGKISKAKKGFKVHSCECGRSYTRAEHLRRHRKNHLSSEMLCEFPDCGRSFSRHDLLLRHQERHTDSVPDQNSRSPLQLPNVEPSQTPLPLPSDGQRRNSTWTDPLNQSLKTSSVTGYTSPIPDYFFADVFQNSPYESSLKRTRTSSNASFIEPWSFPSRSPSSSNSTMAYRWTSTDKSSTTSSLNVAHMGTSYPMTSIPMSAVVDPMLGYDPFVSEDWMQVEEEHRAFISPDLAVSNKNFSDSWPANIAQGRDMFQAIDEHKLLLKDFEMDPTSDTKRCIYDSEANPYGTSWSTTMRDSRLATSQSISLLPIQTRHDKIEDSIHPPIPSPIRAGDQVRDENEPSSTNIDQKNHLEESANSLDGLPLRRVDGEESAEQDHVTVGLDESSKELKKDINGAFSMIKDEMAQLESCPEPLKHVPDSVPSDSGYRSGLGTDTESVCSMASIGESLGLPRDFLQDFIAFFGDTLIQTAGANQWASHTLANHSKKDIERRLNSLLKDFTVSLASETPKSQEISNTIDKPSVCTSEQSYKILDGATNLIRRYRPKITRYFCDNAVSASSNEIPLSLRLQSLGQQLSLSERFDLFRKIGHGNLDPDEMTSNIEPEHEAAVEDDMELSYFADLEPIRELLVSSEAFIRLASNIRRMLYHDDTQEMNNIQRILKDSFVNSDYHFNIDWALVDFMRSQYGEEYPPIGSAIVITGSALYAQATTCEEYIKQTWPKSGTFLMQALDSVLDKSDFGCVRVEIVSKDLRLTIRIETTAENKLIVRIGSTDEDLVIELVQQLAWFGSALSISPYGDQVAYARPLLHLTGSKAEFNIKYQHEPLHATEMPCWLPLFSGAVIASGFPIPERADEMGLEIPLELLAGIAGVQHAVEFQGGVIMKGFSHMFVPVRKVGDRVQWHAISSTDSEKLLTYQEGLSQCGSRALLDEVSLGDINNSRAIVGWCSVGQSRLGSSSANYENIHYSTATETESSMKCAGGSVGFQQFGTAALDFKFGLKEGKCHLKRDGPYRKIVTWAEKTPIVLYDTAERRGWLVSASDVILHIAQCRHRLEPFEVAGTRVTLDTEVPLGSSAKEILLKNIAVRLSDDDDCTFKTEIANIWSILDFLIAENVEREQRSPGATLNDTWCDLLHGFEFNAVVEQHSPFRQKQTKLLNSNGGWPLLSRDIDALVLFANGFEDIVIPAADHGNNNLCWSWQRVPKGKDFLATTTLLLKKLYERAGHPLDRKYLTSTKTKLQWHQGGSLLFEPCTELRHTDCRCNRLQQIFPKSTIGKIVPPEHINDHGAVIFGNSGSIIKNMFTKPRAQSRKISSLYSQENVQLTPITTHQDTDDNSMSDGDTSGRSGSEVTTDSMPSSLSSCTTLSREDVASQLDDASAVTTFSISKKRQRLPEIHILFHDDDSEGDSGRTLDIKRKKTKSAQLERAPHQLAPDRSLVLYENSRDQRSPQPDSTAEKKQIIPTSTNRPLAHSPELSPTFTSIGRKDLEEVSMKPEGTDLAVRLAEPISQHTIRRQNGFYNKTNASC